MFLDHTFNKDVKLHDMVANNPKIRRSIMGFVYRVINMIHSERYDPRTVKFIAMAPAGEPNKISIMLQSAEYSTAPVIEPEIHADDASYKMTRFVSSLYSAVMERNSQVEGFMHVCLDLASFTYVVANRIYDYLFKWRGKDMSASIVWDCFDHWQTGDLIIQGCIPDSPQ